MAYTCISLRSRQKILQTSAVSLQSPVTELHLILSGSSSVGENWTLENRSVAA